MLAAERVLKEAREWVGKNFAAGQSAQCANFVRHVFKAVAVEVGSASKPDDAFLIPGEAIAPSYANSFAGNDVGHKIVTISDLRPGDVVMFKNTYGSWPEGVITHVGIYEGNGYFIHRPTSARPVERGSMSGFWASSFSQGRRPYAYAAETKPASKHFTLKKFSHGLKRTVVSGDLLPAGTHPTVSEDTWMELQNMDGKIKIFLNGDKHVIHIPYDLKKGVYTITSEASTIKMSDNA